MLLFGFFASLSKLAINKGFPMATAITSFNEAPRNAKKAYFRLDIKDCKSLVLLMIRKKNKNLLIASYKNHAAKEANKQNCGKRSLRRS